MSLFFPSLPESFWSFCCVCQNSTMRKSANEGTFCLYRPTPCCCRHVFLGDQHGRPFNSRFPPVFVFFLLYLELCYRNWWEWTNIAVDLQVHLFQAGESCLTASLACDSCVAETDYLVNEIKGGKQRPTQAGQQRCSWGPNQAWPLHERSCVSNCDWCWSVPLTIIRLS